MTLKVLNPGLFSTMQDLGRIGHQSDGFSQAGAADYLSHSVANQLLNNDLNSSTLEMTFQGATLQVLKETIIATAGSEIEFSINGEKYLSGRAVSVLKGDEISFGQCLNGTRTYLAVLGGFNVPPVLNSRSTHTRSGIGGLEGRVLKANDILEAYGGNYKPSFKNAQSIDNEPLIRVIPGQQFDYFNETSRRDFFNTKYEVSKDSDRMGLRLNGASLKSLEGHDVLSEPTQLGSIQVPKNGQPIILLNDRQTAGGYIRIGTVALCDIPKISQIAPGTSLSFQQITVEEAAKEYENILKDLHSGKYLVTSNDFNSGARKTARKILKIMG